MNQLIAAGFKPTSAIDGYGFQFSPIIHLQHIRNGMEQLRKEQEELERNKPTFVQPEWKDKPAGYHEKKGTGW